MKLKLNNMEKRKTLWERLKPEYKQALENERTLYPSTYKMLHEGLSCNYFIDDLYFRDVYSLFLYTDGTSRGLNSVYSMFESIREK